MTDLDAFDFHIKQTENKFNVSCTIPKNLKFFEGHFPGNPVLPGYVIIDATLAMIKKASKKDLSLSTLKNAKFMNIVRPDQAVHIILENLQNQWTATWRDSNEKPVAEIRMVTAET